MMVKAFGFFLLCAASVLSAAHAETFVIESDKSGHEATIKIPVGAVTKLSANFAQSLAGYAPQIEAMRLSGDVLISIAGSEQPIQIKADKLVLELTADSAPDPLKTSRADAAANKRLRSTTTPAGDDDSQVFVGNVVFNLQTPSGPMEIKADRVEHRLGTEAGV
jgi:lipopolysaccharide export system protein LptA